MLVGKIDLISYISTQFLIFVEVNSLKSRDQILACGEIIQLKYILKRMTKKLDFFPRLISHCL